MDSNPVSHKFEPISISQLGIGQHHSEKLLIKPPKVQPIQKEVKVLDAVATEKNSQQVSPKNIMKDITDIVPKHNTSKKNISKKLEVGALNFDQLARKSILKTKLKR